jgi:N-formylglutamate amidohydrolase
MKPILLHIPHSSPHIPLYDGFVIGNEATKNEINLITDWFTDELFDLPFPKIVTPFSRVFCDVERFEDDSLEVMSQYGMGMCYTNMDSGELMRDVSPDLRARIKSEFYIPHHRALESLTTELLQKLGHVTVIDCHSFPEIPLTRDLNQDMPRPDFCLGIDEYHTPVDMYLPVQELLTNIGYTVLINNPYSGTMIPMKYYQKNPNVRGLMIEVNRKLYMEVENGEILKTTGFDRIRNTIKEALNLISH